MEVRRGKGWEGEEKKGVWRPGRRQKEWRGEGEEGVEREGGGRGGERGGERGGTQLTLFSDLRGSPSRAEVRIGRNQCGQCLCSHHTHHCTPRRPCCCP